MPNDQLWQIPVCAKGVDEGSGSAQCFLMTKREQQFTMKGCSKFVFPNAGALGLLPLHYDTPLSISSAMRRKKDSRPKNALP